MTFTQAKVSSGAQFSRAGGAWKLQVLKGYTDDDESSTLASTSIYHRPTWR